MNNSAQVSVLLLSFLVTTVWGNPLLADVFSSKKFRDTGDYFSIEAISPFWKAAGIGQEIDRNNNKYVIDKLAGIDSVPYRSSNPTLHESGYRIRTHLVNEKVSGASNFHFSFITGNPHTLLPGKLYRTSRSFDYNGAPTTMSSTGWQLALFNYNRSRLWELGYNYDLYLLSKNRNRFINPFGIRMGINFTAEDSTMEGPRLAQSNTNYSDTTLNSSTSNILTIEKRKYELGHAELLAGPNYALGFADSILLDFGIDFIYGKGYGKNWSESFALVDISGAPYNGVWANKVIEKMFTTVQGYSAEAGIAFFFTGASVRIYYKDVRKKYVVNSSKFKREGSDIDSTAYYALTGDASPLVTSQLNALTKSPEMKFQNQEIGAAFRIEM